MKVVIMGLRTETETAKILRVSERSLQRWRKVGRGPAFTRVGDRRVTYSDEAIEHYVTGRTFTSTAAALSGVEGGPVWPGWRRVKK